MTEVVTADVYADAIRDAALHIEAELHSHLTELNAQIQRDIAAFAHGRKHFWSRREWTFGEAKKYLESLWVYEWPTDTLYKWNCAIKELGRIAELKELAGMHALRNIRLPESDLVLLFGED